MRQHIIIYFWEDEKDDIYQNKLVSNLKNYGQVRHSVLKREKIHMPDAELRQKEKYMRRHIIINFWEDENDDIYQYKSGVVIISLSKYIIILKIVTRSRNMVDQ